MTVPQNTPGSHASCDYLSGQPENTEEVGLEGPLRACEMPPLRSTGPVVSERMSFLKNAEIHLRKDSNSLETNSNLIQNTPWAKENTSVGCAPPLWFALHTWGLPRAPAGPDAESQGFK